MHIVLLHGRIMSATRSHILAFPLARLRIAGWDVGPYSGRWPDAVRRSSGAVLRSSLPRRAPTDSRSQLRSARRYLLPRSPSPLAGGLGERLRSFIASRDENGAATKRTSESDVYPASPTPVTSGRVPCFPLHVSGCSMDLLCLSRDRGSALQMGRGLGFVVRPHAGVCDCAPPLPRAS